MARSKFTTERRTQIIEAVAAGVSIADAANAAGVRHTTLKEWLAKGRADDAPDDFAAFAAAVDGARRASDERPEPMTRDELKHVVSDMARRGSVNAAKLYADILDREDEANDDPVDDGPNPLAAVDRHAARRRSVRR